MVIGSLILLAALSAQLPESSTPDAKPKATGTKGDASVGNAMQVVEGFYGIQWGASTRDATRILKRMRQVSHDLLAGPIDVEGLSGEARLIFVRGGLEAAYVSFRRRSTAYAEIPRICRLLDAALTRRYGRAVVPLPSDKGNEGMVMLTSWVCAVWASKYTTISLECGGGGEGSPSVVNMIYRHYSRCGRLAGANCISLPSNASSKDEE